MLDLLTRLNSLVTRLRSRSLVQDSRKQQSLAEIERLIAALEARDPAAAREAVIVHVDNAARAALATLPDQDIDDSQTEEPA